MRALLLEVLVLLETSMFIHRDCGVHHEQEVAAPAARQSWNA